MPSSPPTWDGPAFASWLRRWKEAEGLEWGQIADRSGLNVTTVQQIGRGQVRVPGNNPGQTNPGISTLARLARGLGLDLAYVLAKGGLVVGGEDRWDHFNDTERALLRRALLAVLLSEDARSPERNQLLDELTITEEITA
jgi:transcriptional regulator with XRE-family HTH domain